MEATPMLMAIESFTDPNTGESVQAYRDRVAEDHYLARVRPDAFEPAPSTDPGGADEWRGPMPGTECHVVERSTSRSASSRRPGRRAPVRSREQRLPLEEEDLVRRRRLAELEAEDHRRRVTERDRAAERFWNGVDGLLDRHTPGRAAQRRLEEAEDREHVERLGVIARAAREEVDQVCAFWDDDVWN